MINKVKVACVIDDDEIYTFTVERIFARAEIAEKTIFFPEGKSAIDFLQENARDEQVLPDLILLDINMPVLNGWQFLDEYNKLAPQLRKKIPIFIVSSSIADEDLARSKKYKTVTDYIVKPITVEQLQAIHARLK